MTDQKYPEHDKMMAVAKESDAIGRFIDHGPYVLASWSTDDDGNDILVQSWKSIEQVLADWFEIDLDKIEHEKRAMLDGIREAQND